MKYKYIFVFMFLSCLSTAQKVSNITFRQEQSSIIVSYDLETKTSCKISLFVSTDDGKTWQGPLKKVIGDAGAKIATGNHSITWNVLEEFEELHGDKIKFQVKADGVDLETVIIGTQEWTAKNLDVSRYRNGDIIPEVKDPTKWANLKTGAWCYYNNNPENGKIYGKLYNWYAVNDPRGLAPEGFHIPSEVEMKKKYLFTRNLELYECFGPKGKVPLGGQRQRDGKFDSIGSGYWWGSTESDSFEAWNLWWNLYDDGSVASAGVGSEDKKNGLSVRCVRD